VKRPKLKSPCPANKVRHRGGFVAERRMMQAMPHGRLRYSAQPPKQTHCGASWQLQCRGLATSGRVCPD
jgi:hypothetical protein